MSSSDEESWYIVIPKGGESADKEKRTVASKNQNNPPTPANKRGSEPIIDNSSGNYSGATKTPEDQRNCWYHCNTRVDQEVKPLLYFMMIKEAENRLQIEKFYAITEEASTAGFSPLEVDENRVFLENASRLPRSSVKKPTSNVDQVIPAKKPVDLATTGIDAIWAQPIFSTNQPGLNHITHVHICQSQGFKHLLQDRTAVELFRQDPMDWPKYCVNKPGNVFEQACKELLAEDERLGKLCFVAFAAKAHTLIEEHKEFWKMAMAFAVELLFSIDRPVDCFVITFCTGSTAAIIFKMVNLSEGLRGTASILIEHGQQPEWISCAEAEAVYLRSTKYVTLGAEGV